MKSKNKRKSKLKYFILPFIINCVGSSIAHAQISTLPTEEINNTNHIPENKEKLLLAYLSGQKNRNLGFLNAYESTYGLMMPIKMLAKELQLNVEVDVENKTIEGISINGDDIFMIDGQKDTLLINGKEESFDKEYILYGKNDIYINSNLFSLLMPVNFRYDKADNAIYIIPFQPKAPPSPLIPKSNHDIKVAPLPVVIKNESDSEAIADSVIQNLDPISAIDVKEKTKFKRKPASERSKPKIKENSNITISDEKVFIIVSDEDPPRDLGFLTTYEHSAGVFVPLGTLANLLNIDIKVDPQNKSAEGWIIRENKLFIFNGSTNSAFFDNKEKTFDDYLVAYGDNDIYIDSTLLSTLIPITFRLNQAAEEISVSPNRNLSEIDKHTLYNTWLAQLPNRKSSPNYKMEIAPVTAPPKPVSSDQPYRAPAALPPPAPKDAPQETVITRPRKPVNREPDDIIDNKIIDIPGNIIIPDNSLVLQPAIGKEEYAEAIEVFEYQKKYFIPIGSVMKFLDLAVTVDLNNQIASGWVIKEDKKFHLDLKNNKIIATKKQGKFPPNYVQMGEDDIYVESQLLSSWIPIEFKVAKRSLLLKITPKDPLPIQLKMARELNWSKINLNKKEIVTYPSHPSPYKAFTLPFMDLNIGNTYNNSKTATQSPSTFSARLGGDLGYLSSQTFISGTTKDINSLRISAGKEDPQKKLLGPLKASSYSVGDISSYSPSLVSAGGSGRGFNMTNRSLLAPTQFDVTQFIGTGNPGWQVELFRNNNLIGFMQIGNDGKYQFNDIEVLYGYNQFRLVFHGPQGQRYEETKQVLTSETLLKKGDFNYTLSLDDATKTLFGIDEKKANVSNIIGLRAIAGAEYGLSKHLTIGNTFVRAKSKSGIDHTYSISTVKTNYLKNMLIGNDLAFDSFNKGWANKVTGLTSFKGYNLRFEHRNYSNFVTLNEFGKEQDLKSQSEINVNKQLPIFTGIGLGTGIKKEVYNNKQIVDTYSTNVATSFLGMNFNNNFELERTRFNGKTTFNKKGVASVSGSLKGVYVRATSDYTLPKGKFENLNITLQKNISSKYDVTLGYNKNLTTTKESSVSASINRNFDKFRAGVGIQLDNKNQFTIGTNISLAVGRDPNKGKLHFSNKNLSNTGGVSIRAFIDKNYNGIFDKDDEYIKEYSVKVDRNEVHSDKEGYVFVAGLSTNKAQNIVLEENSLSDPLLTTSKPGYTIVSRAGVVSSIEFPLVISSQINGTINKVENGVVSGFPRASIDLVDEASGQVIKTIKAEFDGFYNFEKIAPGNYILKLSEEFLKKHNVTANEFKIKVDSKGDFYDDYNFNVQKKIAEPVE